MMTKIVSKLTVLFEEPFWIGIYEREDGASYEACKITFGAEPKDYEIYDFFMKRFSHLPFSPKIAIEESTEKRINPKRMQRAIHKQLQNNSSIGTKAQHALKLQYEQGKLKRKTTSRQMRESEKERKFELRQQKRTEKHKGH